MGTEILYKLNRTLIIDFWAWISNWTKNQSTETCTNLQLLLNDKSIWDKKIIISNKTFDFF